MNSNKKLLVAGLLLLLTVTLGIGIYTFNKNGRYSHISYPMKLSANQYTVANTGGLKKLDALKNGEKTTLTIEYANNTKSEIKNLFLALDVKAAQGKYFDIPISKDLRFVKNEKPGVTYLLYRIPDLKAGQKRNDKILLYFEKPGKINIKTYLIESSNEFAIGRSGNVIINSK